MLCAFSDWRTEMNQSGLTQAKAQDKVLALFFPVMSETQQPAKAPTEVNKPPPSGSLCPKLVFVVLAVAIGFGCWLEYKVPSIVDPVVFEPGPLPALTGDFKPNARLTQAEKIFEGVVDGPESFAFTKGKRMIHID